MWHSSMSRFCPDCRQEDAIFDWALDNDPWSDKTSIIMVSRQNKQPCTLADCWHSCGTVVCKHHAEAIYVPALDALTSMTMTWRERA